MPSYWVELPISGKICREVEADSEEEAIEIALTNQLTKEEIDNMEWETMRDVVRGNVFSGMLSHANAQLQKDAE